MASKVLMVEPTGFFLNEETFKDNKFMQRVNDSKKKTTDRAILEFKNMEANLKKNGIEVATYKQMKPELPDSIFPNNWFSTHKSDIVPGKYNFFSSSHFAIKIYRRSIFHISDEREEQTS